MGTIAAMFKKPKDGSALAMAQAQADQRRALAQMGRDGAAADAATQGSGAKRGRKLLTFLGAEGNSGLGA